MKLRTWRKYVPLGVLRSMGVEARALVDALDDHFDFPVKKDDESSDEYLARTFRLAFVSNKLTGSELEYLFKKMMLTGVGHNWRDLLDDSLVSELSDESVEILDHLQFYLTIPDRVCAGDNLDQIADWLTSALFANLIEPTAYNRFRDELNLKQEMLKIEKIS